MHISFLKQAVLFIIVINVKSDVFDKQFEDKLDEFIKTTIACRNVPGLTISVTKDNETWTRGYGTADIVNAQPVTSDTLFLIASVTKSFTMVLLGSLLEKHNYTWTTKVKDIMGPDYQFIDNYRTREMMLKDMLSHRTGLAGFDIGFVAGYGNDVTRESLVKKVRYLPEYRPFRDNFIYNNYMFMYLGHICEKLGGDSWENLVQGHILTPLGMMSTRLMTSPTNVQTNDAAKPHILKYGTLQHATFDMYRIHPVEPTGSIQSNGKDMIKYLQFLLNKGKLNNGTQLISEDLLTASFKPINPIEFDSYTKPTWPIEVTPRGYGQALISSTYRGYDQVLHSGSLFSFKTRMFLFPEMKTGVFVSTNGPGYMGWDDLAASAVAYTAVDGALGLEPWLNETTTCTLPEPWVSNNNNYTPPAVNIGFNLTDPLIYAGVYEHNFLPNINLSVILDDNSKLRFRMSRIAGFLHVTNVTDVFALEISEPWEVAPDYGDPDKPLHTSPVTFSRSGGKVTRMTAKFELPVTYRKIEPTITKNSSSVASRIDGQYRVAVSYILDNETWAKGYGYADIDSSTNVTKETLFGIGSITKSFTMALLGVLLKEKNMTWTTKVKDILGPDYRFVDDYRTNETTLKDLLSHRTGLSGLDIGVLGGFTADVTREQLSKRIQYIPEAKPFRDTFIYNNFMYMYLGHICEVLGGETWENLVKSRLLIPLGMTSTKFVDSPTDVQTGNVAKPYIYKDGSFQNATLKLYSIRPVDPAGAILSNGEDMVKWMQFLLNKGRLNDGTVILDDQLLTDAMKVVIPIPEQFTRTTSFTKPSWPIEMTMVGYGHALFTSTYRGYKQVWHSGGFHSYQSIMLLYPDKNSGIFASTTGPSFKSLGSFAVRTIPYFLSDKVLNLEPWLNDTTTCTFPNPWLDDEETPPTSNYTTKNLTDPNIYTGLYEHGFLTSINISTIPDDSSKLTFVANVVSGVLYATEVEDEFRMEVLEPWEIMNAYTDNENRTVTTKVVFHRENGEIVNMITQYDVNITYVRTSSHTISGSPTLYSGVFLFVTLFTFTFQRCLYLCLH